jgi:hypothetical protein
MQNSGEPSVVESERRQCGQVKLLELFGGVIARRLSIRVHPEATHRRQNNYRG